VRKPILLAVFLAVLALALSACDVSALPYAARVGGTTISTSKLNSVLDAFRTDKALRCVFQAQGAVIDGKGAGTFASSFTSARLSELVELRLNDALVAKLHVTPAERAYATSTATSELTTAFGPGQVGSCTTSGPGFLAALPAAYRQVIVGNRTDQILLDAHLAGAELSNSGIASYEQSHPQQMTISCVSAIVVSTQATAEQLASEINKGASFASIAKADSSDTSSAANGGAIGCVAPSDLQAPIGQTVAALQPGQLSAPVAFNSSYVLLEVTSHQGLAPVATALQALLDSEDAAQQASLGKYAAQVSVEVNPQYGSFGASNSGAAVNPPNPPSSSFLVNSGAITP
jgi:parvulin-like peptidyl-prolyl isomerase